MGRLPRSYLYVPGNAPDKLPKAAAGPADALIVDLEDAVPWAEKDATRAAVKEWVEEHPASSKELWVRVNSGETGQTDMEAFIDCTALTGFVLAKASPEAVTEAGRLVSGSSLLLSPLLETPIAVLEAVQIAQSRAVHRLQIGEYDLCAEAGISPGEDEAETNWARSFVVMASAAAGLLPPIAPVSIEIRDSVAFSASTKRARRQGFVGRACIHPRQVEITNRAFLPSELELESARAIVSRFEGLHGAAVMVDDGGRMVDEATIRTARRTLALVDDQPPAS